MAKTPAQLGMVTPTGTDLISQGDNAITTNAEVTADWIGRLLNGEIEIIELNGGEDLNDFRTPGRYILRTASTAAPILNIPPGMSHNVFYLRVVSHTVGSFQYVMQDWSGLSDSPEGEASGYFRRNTSGASGALYIPWRRLDNDFAAAQGGAGIANVLRVQEFKDAFPPINTTGRAAVALRFDHGLANFNTKIRPLLEARNLPYCLALSSRHWGAAENAGVTAAMVDSWNLAEVWNHGAGNHQDASDLSALTDMIVTGKAELQAQLPNKTIWGFIPPGVGGTNYGGFNGGDSPEAFYGTLAGQLILENHAVSAGAYPGTAYRPLDGEVRQGMSHAGLETRSVSSLQSLVNTAISDKTGLQLMTHPSRLDEAGYHTTADLTQMLDYIVAKRDSGELVVLSPYEIMIADIGATTDNAGLSDRVSELEADKFYRGHNVVTDLNLATEQGLYTFGSLPANAPTTASGDVEVHVTGTTILQRWTTLELVPRVFQRRRSSGTWGAWSDPVEISKNGRGILPSGTVIQSLNLPIHNGEYALTQDLMSTYVGLPAGIPAGVRGTLRVESPNNWTVTHEIHINSGTVHWIETMLSPTGPVFNAWQKIDTSLIGGGGAGNPNNRSILAASTDLNTLCLQEHHGDYALSSPNWSTYINLPPGITEASRGTLEVISPNNWTVTHRVTPSAGTKRYERVMTSPTGPVFAPWRVFDSASTGAGGVVTASIPTDDWVHWGDSLTDDAALGSDAWVTKLSTLTGKDHVNEGWYGQQAAQIAARQGGNPALMTVEGGSIPASGTQVKVIAATPHVSMPVGAQQPTRQVPGTLGGRTGYLVDGGVDASDGFFMPTDGAGVSTASGVQQFIPSGVADSGRNRVMTICVGENDIWATGPSPQHVAYMARQMNDYQNTHVKRVLVLSIPRRSGSGTGTVAGDKVTEINDALKAELPSAFVDLAGYMMSDQAATDAGITYTADDLADIADGVTPRVFRLPSDSVHFNALGCSIIAPFIYAAAKDRGWTS